MPNPDVIHVIMDDWEALIINGEVAYEDHRIQIADVIGELVRLGKIKEEEFGSVVIG